MKKKKSPGVWAYQPQAPKFKADQKTKLLAQVKDTIAKLPKLTQKVSRIDMRSNWIYLYELVEQFQPEGAIFIKPLIDGKYLEFPYARITLYDTQGDNCSVEWQRPNNQWVTLYTGTLAECLDNLENDECWF